MIICYQPATYHTLQLEMRGAYVVYICLVQEVYYRVNTSCVVGVFSTFREIENNVYLVRPPCCCSLNVIFLSGHLTWILNQKKLVTTFKLTGPVHRATPPTVQHPVPTPGENLLVRAILTPMRCAQRR